MFNQFPKRGNRIATAAALVALCLLEASCGKSNVSQGVRSVPKEPRVAHRGERKVPKTQEAPQLSIGGLLTNAAVLEPNLNADSSDTYNPVPANVDAQALVTVFSPTISELLKQSAHIKEPQYDAGVLFTSYPDGVTESMVIFEPQTLQVVQLNQVDTLHPGLQPLFGQTIAEDLGFGVDVEPESTPVGYGVQLLIGGLVPGPDTLA